MRPRSDYPWGLDAQILRDGVEVLVALHRLSACFKVFEGYQQALGFAAGNLERLLSAEYDKLWQKAGFPVGFDLDRISEITAHLIWKALCLGRMVNQYRSGVGRKPIDFYARAIELDRKLAQEKANEQAAQADHPHRESGV